MSSKTHNNASLYFIKGYNVKLDPLFFSISLFTLSNSFKICFLVLIFKPP
nr:MAG TPA: hypothetical protein [Caudoviricetes sp.]